MTIPDGLRKQTLLKLCKLSPEKRKRFAQLEAKKRGLYFPPSDEEADSPKPETENSAPTIAAPTVADAEPFSLV